MKSIQWLDRSVSWLRLHYCLCINEQQFYKETKRLGFDKSEAPFPWKSDANTTFFVNKKDNKQKIAIVCISGYEERDPINTAALLVHEATHIWQEHCQLQGEECPSAEYEAYAIQWISQQLMYSFRDQLSNIK